MAYISSNPIANATNYGGTGYAAQLMGGAGDDELNDPNSYAAQLAALAEMSRAAAEQRKAESAPALQPSAYAQAKAARQSAGLPMTAANAPARPGMADMFRPNYTKVSYRHDWQKSGLRPEATNALDSILGRVANRVPAVEIASAYRSPAYNRKVGGARSSQHMAGRAFDVTLRDLAPDQQEALVDSILAEPSVRGFGYYPRSNSIHFDVRPGTGRAYWGADYSRGSWSAPAWMNERVQAWASGRAPQAAQRARVMQPPPDPRARPDTSSPAYGAQGARSMPDDSFAVPMDEVPMAGAPQEQAPAAYAPPPPARQPPAQQAIQTLVAEPDGVYRVKKGDTLGAIAKRSLGSAGRWREIAELNGIRPGEERRLMPGQTIRLPGTGAPAPVAANVPSPRPRPSREVDIPIPRQRPQPSYAESLARFDEEQPAELAGRPEAMPSGGLPSMPGVMVQPPRNEAGKGDVLATPFHGVRQPPTNEAAKGSLDLSMDARINRELAAYKQSLIESGLTPEQAAPLVEQVREGMIRDLGGGEALVAGPNEEPIAGDDLRPALSPDNIFASAPDFTARSRRRFDDTYESGNSVNPDTQAALDSQTERGSWLDPVMQGVTMGFGDELAGAFGGAMDAISGGSFDEGYARTRDTARGNLEAYRARNPVASTALEIAGAVPTALIPGGAAVRGANIATKVGRGMAAGAGYGAVAGYGAGEGGVKNRVENATRGAAVGAAVGGAVPVAGRVIGKAVGRRQAVKSAPSRTDIHDRKTALYDQADRAGIAVNPPALERAGRVIPARMQKAGIDPTLHPNASAALRRVEQLADTGMGNRRLSLSETETVRKVIVDATKSPNKADRYMAGQILEHFDQWRTSLAPRDMVNGRNMTGREAIGILKEAQTLAKREAKGDTLAQLVENAQNADRDFGTALRQEFRTLARNKNRMRQFSSDEQSQIKSIVRGGPIDWVLRAVGMASPAGGTLALLRGVAAGAAGSPVLPIVGYGAQKMAGRRTGKAVERMDAGIRSGNARGAVSPSAENATDAALGTAGQAAGPQIVSRWGNDYALDPASGTYRLIGPSGR